MTSRFRWILLAGTLGLAGCGDAFNAGPISFVPADRLNGEEFATKPKLRQKVIALTNELFGESPRRPRVPAGAGLPHGGIYLGNRVEIGDAKARRVAAIAYVPAGRKAPVPLEGGHALYRRHCLHCHGVSGDGNGPTANYLFPRPRDFRPGLFKFTSTAVGAKPTRADLRKTILQGLPGTSMPSFEALMEPLEVEQVIDFVTFLSMRGEVEKNLVDEAAIAEEGQVAEALTPDVVAELTATVFERWKTADEQVVVPETPRVPPSPESIARGRSLF
ncbi:MAG TPA: cytochrome c, partial [Isosphaeraceae bacterium]